MIKLYLILVYHGICYISWAYFIIKEDLQIQDAPKN